MIRILTLLLCFPSVATADILVRTAEHGDFTRVVIDYETPAYQRTVENLDEIRIMADTVEGYDLKGVYRRINDKRISEIRQVDGGLVIKKVCDCESRIDHLISGTVIIDIVERRVRRNPSSRKSRDIDFQAESERDEFPVKSLLDSSLQSVVPVFAGALSNALAKQDKISGEIHYSPLENLGSGADLELDAWIEAPDARELLGFDKETNFSDNDGFRSRQISVDSRRRQFDDGRTQVPAAKRCEPMLQEPVEEWLNAVEGLSPSAGQRAILRATMKSLIIRGFGAEAASLLPMIEGAPDLALLTELASLMDKGTEAPLVSSMSECGELAALFSTFADPATPPLPVVPLFLH